MVVGVVIAAPPFLSPGKSQKRDEAGLCVIFERMKAKGSTSGHFERRQERRRQ